MSMGVRNLTVLGELKPFGYIVESLDGKVSDAIDGIIILTNRSLSIQEIHLTFPVLKVCWCRLGHKAEAVLCALQFDCLTVYNTSGQMTSITLPHTVSSTWSLPFGLLLQKEMDVNISSHDPFSSSSPLLCARNMSRSQRDFAHSPQHSSSALSTLNYFQTGDMVSMSSHLILMDPLEEQQPTFIEERGKFNIMKICDEKTIWTSVQVPLMVSYNKGKMQHSVWVPETVTQTHPCKTDISSLSVDPVCVSPRQLNFH